MEMKTVTHPYEASIEVKQSKFIAVLTPYHLFAETLLSLREKHPKARHFVVAYRYRNDFGQIVEYSTDDGEPKGTAGKPALFVLAGVDMMNCAVIVVRYFGGTKLGTGGLVRAYSDSVNHVMNEVCLIEYREKIVTIIEFEYSFSRLVEYECAHENIEIVEKKFDLHATYTLRGTKQEIETLLHKMPREIKIQE
jgi:uncharacterized YigZ family protein